MRVGITGHQQLGNAAGWVAVRKQLVQVLQRLDDVQGLSSLARGADQLFAEVVLESGGRLIAVIPFPGYGSAFSPEDRRSYEALVRRASDTVVLQRRETLDETYLAAGKYIADHSDILVAVWDGMPARGLGGTGDIVAYARLRGLEVLLIDSKVWA